MGEPRLAVAIPAYGQPEWTARNLQFMAEAGRRLNIAFYVSDDTPDDSVERAIRQIAPELGILHYRRNTPGLGHDRNLLATLTWPEEEYVWLLRSAMWARPDALERLLPFLAGQDLVCVNSHSDDRRMIPAVSGEAARTLLREALWHQTLTGATIYGRRVTEWVRRQGDALVVKRNFPQLSVIMGFASTDPVAVGWFGEPAVNTSYYGHSYWRARAVDVFVDDWAGVVTAFPAVVPPAQQARVIGEHSRRMALFDASTLIELRRSGQFGWSSLRRPHFLDAMHLPRWKLLALLVMPDRVLGYSRRVRGLLRRLRRNRGSAA